MFNNDIEKYVDYIENFDKKSIQVVFLFIYLPAGNLLLHSLVNGHKNILNIPNGKSTYSYFNDFISKRDDARNSIEYFVKKFVKSNYFNYGECWGNIIPEENKSPYFLAEFEKILLLILTNLNEINSRNFFLAVNFAYAHMKNIDISKIKVIFQHDHTIPFEYSFDNASPRENSIFKVIKEDFPNLKIILNIRNFIDSFNSHIDAIRKRDQLNTIINQNNILAMYYSILNYYAIFLLKNIFKDNLKIIKFEDIHLKTEQTMMDLAHFLDIEFNLSMLESSFEGRLWYWNGYDLKKHQHGTNPNFDTSKWKEVLKDYRHEVLCMNLLNPLNKKLGYEEYTRVKNDGKIYELTNFDREFCAKLLLNQAIGDYSKIKADLKFFNLFYVIFIILWYSFKEIFVRNKTIYILNLLIAIKHIKFQLFEYKKERANLINKLNKIAKQLNEFNCIEEFANFWLEENRYEKNFLIKTNFECYLKKLSKKLKNKPVVIYGAGKLFNTICENYDLSRLNIIGVCDKNYEKLNYLKPTHSYKPIPPSEINKYQPYILLISVIKTDKECLDFIINLLKNNNRTKIDFLYRKSIIDLRRFV